MTDIEQRLWDRLKQETNNETDHTVRISRIADRELPVPNKKWVTDTVKSWENRGLVVAKQNGAQARLTEDGVTTEVVGE
jgi:Mn-dependent DtxR family transcriptional regulator